jgi:hypothetical protein
MKSPGMLEEWAVACIIAGLIIMAMPNQEHWCYRDSFFILSLVFLLKKIKFAKKDTLSIFNSYFINIIRLATDEKHLF